MSVEFLLTYREHDTGNYNFAWFSEEDEEGLNDFLLENKNNIKVYQAIKILECEQVKLPDFIESIDKDIELERVSFDGQGTDFVNRK